MTSYRASYVIFLFLLSSKIQNGCALISPVGPLFDHRSLDTMVEKARSLKALCAAHIVLGECHCQGDCALQITCCKHQDLSKMETSRTTLKRLDEKNLHFILSLLLESTISHKPRNCHPLFPPHLSNGDKSNSYFMVDTCLEGAGEIEQKKCSSDVDEYGKVLLPVLGENNMLYKNFYCAKCRKVNIFEGVLISKKCKTEKSSNKSDCIFSIESSDSSALLCTKQFYEDTCSRENRFYDLCQNYKKKPTKDVNYFCYLCSNGYNLTLNTYLQRCDKWLVIHPYKYSYCYDITNEHHSRTCDYPLKCPDGYLKGDGKCYLMSRSMLKTLAFDNCFKKLKLKVFFVNNFDLTEFNVTEMPKLEVVLRNKYSTVMKTQKVVDPRIINRIHKMPKSTYGLVVLHQDQDSIAYKVALGLSRVFPGKRLCAKTVNLWSDDNAIISSDCKVHYNKKVITLQNLSIWKTISNKDVKRILYSCDSFYLPPGHCPLRILDSNVELDRHLTLHHTENGVVTSYKTADFVPLESFTFGVCKEKQSTKKGESSFYTSIVSIQPLLSIVCTVMSVMSYVVAILLYLCIYESQYHHNLWILILCAFLVIDDTSFLALILTNFFHVNISLMGCFAIKSMNKLFSLLSHLWSTSIVVSVSCNTCLIHKSLINFGFINIRKCATLSLFFSLIIVFTGISFSEKRVFDEGFSTKVSCNSDGFYTRTLLYLTPIVLCTAVSLTFLVGAGYSRLKHRRQSILAKGDPIERSNFEVLIKIVLICAFTDIMGYIQFSESSTFKYLDFNLLFALLFDVARLIRGMSILFTVACRKDVYTREMFRDRKMARIDSKTSREDSQN